MKDQVPGDVTEEPKDPIEGEEPEGDQPPKKQSEKTDDKGQKKTIKPKGKLTKLVKGLQKGYTQTRQDIANILEKLEGMSNTAKIQVDDEGDEYITVSKLKEILTENANSQAKAQDDRKTKAEDYIKQVKTDLQAQGIINSKDDWKEFEKYAMKHKLSDLYKAAKLWQDVKKAAKQGLKSKAKKKARQKESSKIGTSQKAGQPGKGVSFDEIHGTDWDDIE